MPLPRNFTACYVPIPQGATFCQNMQKEKVEMRGVLIKTHVFEDSGKKKLISPTGVRKASWVIMRHTTK